MSEIDPAEYVCLEEYLAACEAFGIDPLSKEPTSQSQEPPRPFMPFPKIRTAKLLEPPE